MKAPQYIDTLAEKIIAVRIRLDGTITPILRQRTPEGRMANLPTHATLGRATVAEPVQFVARVRAGDSGVLAMPVADWDFRYSHGVIPLGKACRFTHDAGWSDPATETLMANQDTNPDEVWFRWAEGKLTWKCGSTSGAALINETYPSIDVVLRLPAGHHGEICFTTPLFTTADGEPASVLSVA